MHPPLILKVLLPPQSWFAPCRQAPFGLLSIKGTSPVDSRVAHALSEFQGFSVTSALRS